MPICWAKCAFYPLPQYANFSHKSDFNSVMQYISLLYIMLVHEWNCHIYDGQCRPGLNPFNRLFYLQLQSTHTLHGISLLFIVLSLILFVRSLVVSKSKPISKRSIKTLLGFNPLRYSNLKSNTNNTCPCLTFNFQLTFLEIESLRIWYRLKGLCLKITVSTTI